MSVLKHAEPVWDTVVSLHLGGADPMVLHEARRTVVAWCHEVDRALSPFRPESDLCRWQRGEVRPRTVLAEVLECSDLVRDLTLGWFDDRTQTHRDPTGVTKGWAVDRAMAMLADLDVDWAQVNAGGDLRVSGDREWRLGIEDPCHPDLLLDVVTGRELCLATSGSRHRGDHIRGADGSLTSASVLGPDLARADGVATALVAAGGSAPDLLASLERHGYAGLLLFADHSVHASPQWPGRLHGPGSHLPHLEIPSGAPA